MRRLWPIGIITAALLAGGAPGLAHEECDEPEVNNPPGSHQAQSQAPQLPAAMKITIKLFQYQPGRVQVKAGTTVTWINDDEIFHTVTVDSKDKSFDAALESKGESFSFTFSKPGIYTYYCDRHEHMRGEIEVL